MSEPVTQTYGVYLRVEFDEYHEVVASSFEEAVEKAERCVGETLPSNRKVRPVSACNDEGERATFPAPLIDPDFLNSLTVSRD